MKGLAVAVTALVFSGAALAESTTVKRTETPYGDHTSVTRQHDDGSVTHKSIDSTGALGCESRSVTKTDGDGDSVTKSKTRC